MRARTTKRGLPAGCHARARPWRGRSLRALDRRRSTTRTVDALIAHEWLVPLGDGGYISSTASGINSRSYHGWLVAPLAPPPGRFLLVSHVDDEWFEEGEDDGVPLFARHYLPDVVHPRGDRLVESFRPEPVPQWTLRVGATRLRRAILPVDGASACVVVHDLLDGPGGRLVLRPFLSGRSFHGAGGEAVDGRLELSRHAADWRPDGLPVVTRASGNGVFEARRVLHERFLHEEEVRRGYHASEDIVSPFEVVIHLTPEAPRSWLQLAAGEPDAGVAPLPGPRSSPLSSASELTPVGPLERLRRAALAPLVRDPVTGRPGILAGYHWFNEWGRDTMIALPGVAAALGSWRVPVEILLAWAARLDGGLLPNRLAEGAGEDHYNSADAPLWFARAVELALRSGDATDAETRDLGEALARVLRAYERGTRFGIGLDPVDGLLSAGDSSTQLTWMDAKTGDHVVTPRAGKCVELNALFHNALEFGADLDETAGRGERARERRALAARMRASFEPAFWLPSKGTLRDVAGDPRSFGIRPNQVFALALPRSILASSEARSAVLASIDRALVTPRGLRTLSPDDPRYRGRYEGDQRERDMAYHQGTVWPWLLGAWVDAHRRHGRGAASLSLVRRVLDGLVDTLDEAASGHLSEIFEGDPPHAARGAVAQAWSAAEVYRAARDCGLTDGGWRADVVWGPE